jgi:hypothetical protein
MQTTINIEAGGSLSNAFRLDGFNKLAIQTPSSWTTATLTFQGCGEQGGTYADIYTDFPLAELVLPGTISALQAISIESFLATLKNFSYIKIRSGTSSTPVVQAVTRTINIYLS